MQIGALVLILGVSIVSLSSTYANGTVSCDYKANVVLYLKNQQPLLSWPSDLSASDLECAYASYLDTLIITYIISQMLSARAIAHLHTIHSDQAAVRFSTDNNTLFNLITIYDRINSLPLRETIVQIKRFCDEFWIALDNLTHESEHHFATWLRSRLVLFPLSVGVILIKLIQYFWSPPADPYPGYGGVGLSGSFGGGGGFGGTFGTQNNTAQNFWVSPSAISH